jgi:myo-inositol-1(or 4)-monophosphatase
VQHDITTYLAVASRLARDAGRYALDAQKSELRVTTKSNLFDLVTHVDTHNEEFIRAGVLSRFPDHAFLGEEGGAHGDAEVKWIVDPIDGTINYAHGLPIWCISVGIEISGKPACGVIYDPTRDELFSASLGGGAFLNGERLNVSSTTDPTRSLLVTGFPYNIAENPNKSIERFAEFLKRGILVRRLGSAALDLAYVAAGRFDGFFEGNLAAWDVAAGAVILTEAGGKLTHYDDKPYSIYGKSIVASNGHCHDFMLEVLGSV